MVGGVCGGGGLVDGDRGFGSAAIDLGASFRKVRGWSGTGRRGGRVGMGGKESCLCPELPVGCCSSSSCSLSD